MSFGIPYFYVAQCKMRPSRVETVKFITSAQWKFECGTIAAATKFPALVHLKIGKQSIRPFSSAVDLFARVTLHVPIVVEPGTEIRATFHNKSSRTRKWNAVQLVLDGSHMLRRKRA